MKNIYEVLAKIDNEWYSAKLGEVNQTPVFARAMNNCEAQFHVHEKNDEMFIVVDGELCIDLEKESIILNKGQTFTVLAGTLHRVRVPGFAHLIVIGG